MKRHPVNKISWSPYHDSAYDFRVIAEFTQRFPHLQFRWFARHTPQTTGELIKTTVHAIQFRTDRAGLRSLDLPRPKHGQTYGSNYRPGYGPPSWSWHTDGRCKLPYTVTFRCDRLSESHPLAWLAPSRIESTPFAGDLDSLVWADMLEAA